MQNRTEKGLNACTEVDQCTFVCISAKFLEPSCIVIKWLFVIEMSSTHWDRFVSTYPVFIDECTQDEFQQAMNHYLQFHKMSIQQKREFQTSAVHFIASGRKS